jgi:hypothetical protein
VSPRPSTYIWESAIVTVSDLGLVGVDEDSGVSRRPTSAVACNNSIVGPSYGLLMDELDGGRRLWLRMVSQIHYFDEAAAWFCRQGISLGGRSPSVRTGVPSSPLLSAVDFETRSLSDSGPG